MSDDQHQMQSRPGAAETTGRRVRPWVWAVVGAVIVCALGFLLVHTVVNAQGHRKTLRPTDPALQPPSGLNASGTVDGSVLLAWQPPRQHLLIGYRIYRAIGRHGSFTIIGTVDSPYIDTFTDRGALVAGTTYSYRVTAFTRQAESAPTDRVMVILLSGPRPTPTVASVGPLPTFPPVTAATFTAVAKAPRAPRTAVPATSVAPSPGTATVLPAPSGTAAAQPTVPLIIATPVPTAQL